MGKKKRRGLIASIAKELLVDFPIGCVQQVLGTGSRNKSRTGKTVHTREVHHHHHHHHKWHKLEVHPDYKLKVVKNKK